MAAITYAYQAYYSGYATPTQLHQIDIADKALAEIDQIRDLTDPVNRRKLRILGENMVRNYLADGDPEDLDNVIDYAYSSNTVETHAPLLAFLERLATPPEPY